MCYCDGPKGRINAPKGSPPGTPPIRVGRPMATTQQQPKAVGALGGGGGGTLGGGKAFGGKWGEAVHRGRVNGHIQSPLPRLSRPSMKCQRPLPPLPLQTKDGKVIRWGDRPYEDLFGPTGW